MEQGAETTLICIRLEPPAMRTLSGTRHFGSAQVLVPRLAMTGWSAWRSRSWGKLTGLKIKLVILHLQLFGEDIWLIIR